MQSLCPQHPVILYELAKTFWYLVRNGYFSLLNLSKILFCSTSLAFASLSNGPFDPQLIEDVYSVLDQHDNELNEAWRLTNQQVRENLITAFRKELEQWPREFSELSSKKL